MNFWTRWVARTGNIGGTARAVAFSWNNMQSVNPGISPEDIAKTFLDIRYGLTNEMSLREKVAGYLVDKKVTPYNLAWAILEAEHDLYGLEDGVAVESKIIKEWQTIVREELEKLSCLENSQAADVRIRWRFPWNPLDWLLTLIGLFPWPPIKLVGVCILVWGIVAIFKGRGFKDFIETLIFFPGLYLEFLVFAFIFVVLKATFSKSKFIMLWVRLTPIIKFFVTTLSIIGTSVAIWMI